MTDAESMEILAAGVVVSRKDQQVLLIHRPKYDDWSFPKGKLDPGEHVTAAAVREVAEETGLTVRLGPPLPDQQYLVGNGTVRSKRVSYWAGRVVGPDDIAGYVPNTEVDAVRWLDLDEARDRLTHERDRETLDAFTALRPRTTPLLVLRHARARNRRTWPDDDRERPLSDEGIVQSDRVVPVLAAYDVRLLVSSSSRRCWTTLAPYAHVADIDLRVTDALSQEDADEAGVREVVHDLLTDETPAVLCTHRPVLPFVWAALGVPEARLEAGGMLVIHHHDGRVVATEQHTV